MIVLYGISNCDTVKKARRFLENHSVPYQFHDFRKEGLSAKQVDNWLNALGLDVLINKRSRTWKELSSKQRAALAGDKGADLIANNPTLIKRPVLELAKAKSKPVVGFVEQQYVKLFS